MLLEGRLKYCINNECGGKRVFQVVVWKKDTLPPEPAELRGMILVGGG